RSPHAHAVIRGVDTGRAAATPGVLAVLTGDDVARDRLGTMAVALPRKRPDGSPIFARPHQGLARGRARFVRDAVALAAPDRLARAAAGAERAAADHGPLPAVTAPADTVAAGAPAVWDECPDNISNVFEVGDKAATEAAIATAAHVVKRRYVISR